MDVDVHRTKLPTTEFLPSLCQLSSFGPKPNGNRYEQFSHLRRREIKVPSPPTREGRGEGKAVRDVSVLDVDNFTSRAAAAGCSQGREPVVDDPRTTKPPKGATGVATIGLERAAQPAGLFFVGSEGLTEFDAVGTLLWDRSLCALHP
jgi:hypothetical protein